MDHSQAVEQTATERYLLDEMTPEQREAFEEHFFDCQECALDLRATAAFVEEAKTLLPELTAEPAAAERRAAVEKRDWFARWRSLFASPMLAGPVFAALLIVVGYQNIVVYPALRSDAAEPRFVQQVALRDPTRSDALKLTDVSRKGGLELELTVVRNDSYQSFAVQLYDAQGKAVWSKEISEPAASLPADGTLSLAVPSTGLHSATYSVAVFGVAADGSRAAVGRYDLSLHFND